MAGVHAHVGGDWRLRAPLALVNVRGGMESRLRPTGKHINDPARGENETKKRGGG